MKTTATQEQLMTLAVAAFLPLETHASLENDEGREHRYQIRVLAGRKAIHIEEMPVHEVRGEQDLHGWIGRMRGRLEEKGYELEPWERTAAAFL